MHSSMKFMLVSVFPDYGCSNSTCNLPKNDIAIFTGMYIVKEKSLAMMQAFFEHEVTFTK